MLDFNKVIQQIECVGAESLPDKGAERDALKAAARALEEASSRSSLFLDKLEENSDLVIWPLSKPLEDIAQSYAVERASMPHTVVAADGSQIMPSHHEVKACYLLNIGRVMITYGARQAPALDSVPQLYHRPEELYPLVDRRRLHIDELYVSLERNLLELKTLRTLAEAATLRQLPVVALLDGSLIPWSVEKMPAGYQKEYVSRMVSELSVLKALPVPVIGYLSHSRSSEIINDLRVFLCPFEKSDCRKMCAGLNEEEFPCSVIWPLPDRQLFALSLQSDERTPVFLSGASVARSLPFEHQTCFLYLNVKEEIARLEFPRWVFADRSLLQLSLSVVLSQVGKGMGYPLCLSEAHNLAVIRGADRQKFFNLLARHLVSLGVRQVNISPKEARKRRSIV